MNAPPLKCSFAVACVCLLAALPANAAETTLESVEKSAGDWVKLRVETTRIETDWRSERGLVESMAAALEERAKAMEEKRDLAKAKTAKDREELDAMRAKNLVAHQDLQAAEGRLKELNTKLAALRPSFPPRLSEALGRAFLSLADPALPLAERMQLTTTVLNRCAQFNRLVNAGEDVLTLDGEPGAKSFETIYWGLSHGYAIDRASRKAWLGAPEDGAWKWQAQPEAFDAVVQLVAVAGDKADPDFVTVPARVARSVGSSSNK
jgi:hypothetical protein